METLYFKTLRDFDYRTKTGEWIIVPKNTIFQSYVIPLINEIKFVSLYASLSEEDVMGNESVFQLMDTSEFLTYTEGDLLVDAFKYDVIAHGCNCFNSMGAGIAAGVAKLFPLATETDAKTTSGDKQKLGQVTFAKFESEDQGELTVVNAYTQYHPGSKEQGYEKEKSIQIREWAIRKSMQKIKSMFSGKKIALPLIGAGIAGGDWLRIERIIREELLGEDVTIVIWEGNSDDFFNKFGGLLMEK